MKVAVIMGSKSDLEVMQKATELLKEFAVEVDQKIVSAHRTPQLMYEFASNAQKENYDVIIAGAGGSAHLPGMVAALTIVPVIGVPIKSRMLKGVDSLLSIVQMPKGIPVATVAINASENAALLAISIGAINNADLADKLLKWREKQAQQALC